MSAAEHQASMIDALEQALVDAKSGRLTAFAFAGIGHDEHVIAYSFDDEDVDGWWYLIGAVDKVRGELVLQAAPPASASTEAPR